MLAAPQYSFGPFVFDAKARVLYRDSRIVDLPPKAAETLALLLAHAGTVMDKPALLDAVWAGRSVGESSLTRTISILRAALGDDATSDGYIDTISKRGYRFSAPVTRSSDPESLSDTVSIAVLPLDSFNGGADQEAFCNGLMEEITAQLYKRGAGWLRVLARTSCMAYGNTLQAHRPGGARARRELCDRRKCARFRQPHAHRGATHPGGGRNARLGGKL